MVVDREAIDIAINSPMKSQEEIDKLIHDSDLKTEEYLLSMKDCFSSSEEQMKKRFTI